MKRPLSRRPSGGFTLIEMLIVVAIIAVLVAVSIPLVGASLEQAREATDQANERAAKAAAMVEYITAGRTSTTTYFYCSDGTATAVLNDSDWPPAGSPGYDYGQSKAHKDGYLKVEFTVEHDVLSITTDWLETKPY